MDLQKLTDDFAAAFLVLGACMMLLGLLGIGGGIAASNLPLALFASSVFAVGVFAYKLSGHLARERAPKKEGSQ